MMKRSVYSKIFSVLQVARGGTGYEGTGGLIKEIVSLRIDIFVRSVYSEQKDEMELSPSLPAIRNAVKWSKQFGFLDDDAQLTKIGRRASNELDFSKILLKAALERLEEGGAGIERLNRSVSKAISSKLENLPTVHYLYDVLKPSITRKNFGFYLSILQDCGAAHTCHKKLYLGFEKG